MAFCVWLPPRPQCLQGFPVCVSVLHASHGRMVFCRTDLLHWGTLGLLPPLALLDSSAVNIRVLNTGVYSHAYVPLFGDTPGSKNGGSSDNPVFRILR